MSRLVVETAAETPLYTRDFNLNCLSNWFPWCAALARNLEITQVRCRSPNLVWRTIFKIDSWTNQWIVSLILLNKAHKMSFRWYTSNSEFFHDFKGSKSGVEIFQMRNPVRKATGLKLGPGGMKVQNESPILKLHRGRKWNSRGFLNNEHSFLGCIKGSNIIGVT